MVIDPRIGPKNVGRDFGFDRELNRGIFTNANPGIWIGVNRERKMTAIMTSFDTILMMEKCHGKSTLKIASVAMNILVNVVTNILTSKLTMKVELY